MKKVKKNYLEPESPQRVERVILIVYLFHTLSLLAVIVRLHWSLRALIPLLAGAPILLYLHVRQVKSYPFRAYFTAVLFWINVALYGLYTDDFLGLLTSVAALTMLLALYGLPPVFAIGNLFYTALVLYHFFFLRDISFSATEQGMRTVTRVLSIYLIEILAYYLVRTQQESRRHLLQNIESLRRAEHSKDDFMANVSHEIRTPVNTICGMSEIVLHSNLSQETRSYVYHIQTAGRNLLSIVSDILDFSELETGKISLAEDSYSITSVVNDIISTANAKNSEKHLELVVDCDPSMPSRLVGDRQKICRAVVNVIDNAIKFTQEGGAVLTVSTRKEDYGVNLCITVQDTGIGIRPEILEKIFTSFNQADARRNRAEGGIGLGLAISKAIVNRMGGFLQISSTFGQGTCVSIVIPQKVEDPTPCISVKDAHEKRILVYLHLDRNKYALLRDGSQAAVAHMAASFDVTAFACRNLAEVKRRVEDEPITNLFIGWEEYNEAPSYFEEIAQDLQVTLIIDYNEGEALPEGNILCIASPLSALSVASILNGENVHDLHMRVHQNRFAAPDAHVLIVDDNLMNLKVIEGLLRPYRIKITTAQSGQEALKKLRAKAFDFVFMDHMMPEMDGVETFRRIREMHDSYYQNLPVIALTANAVGNAREMFLAEGFADYVSKPIEMSALDHILRKYIPRAKMISVGKEIPTGFVGGGHKAADNPVGDPTGLGAKPHDNTFSAADDDHKNTSSGSRSSCIQSLKKDGIDTELGIRYCGGNLSDYLEIVRLYCAEGEKNIARIRNACDENDWSSFVIGTHTAKSTSKSIGAVRLSALAKELEARGRDLMNDCQDTAAASAKISAIRKLTEEMLTEYARVLKALRGNQAVFPDADSNESDEAVLSRTTKNSGEGNAHPHAPQGNESCSSEETECSGEDNNLPALSPEEFRGCCRELAVKLDTFDSEEVLKYLDDLSGRHPACRDVPLSELFAPVRACVEDFDFIGAQDALNDIKESNQT